MLINTNIKKIIGGGCEIKEVRYKDKVVWTKAPKYFVECIFEGKEEVVTVSFNQIKSKAYTKMNIDSYEPMFRVTCEIDTKSGVYLSLYRNGKLIENGYRDKTLDILIRLQEGYNKIKLIVY